jgi:aryl-alcohol dehydrogenase-like predicted oxidoreductase
MEKRRLGTSEVQITPILMGTWQAGKRWWVGIDDRETTQAIRAAFEAGMTTIDTAEVYGDGHSEQIVAQALAGVRDQVVYATKVFPNHLRYDQLTLPWLKPRGFTGGFRLYPLVSRIQTTPVELL